MHSPYHNHLRTAGGVIPSARAGESAGEGWRFSVIPFLWMPGLNGETGVRGVTAAVDASFIDIFDTMKDADSFIGLLGGSRPDTGPGADSSMGCNDACPHPGVDDPVLR